MAKRPDWCTRSVVVNTRDGFIQIEEVPGRDGLLLYLGEGKDRIRLTAEQWKTLMDEMYLLDLKPEVSKFMDDVTISPTATPF